MSRQRFTKSYMRLILAIGVGMSLFSVYHLPFGQLDINFWLLALATVGIISRFDIQLPQLNSQITISDTFIFLTMLLYGGEAAILLAAADMLCHSSRVHKRPITILFNAAAKACSTFVTVWTLRFCFGTIEGLLHSGHLATFTIAICVMALMQYIADSALIAVCAACKTDQPLWDTWKKHYLWSSITYFAGAATAGITVQLIDKFSFYTVLAVSPIVVIIYLTYQMYLKTVAASIAQAEQSHRFASALQESEERFRSSFDYAAIGMAVVSPQGRWLKVNNSLCEIIGYSEPELLETEFHAITHEDDLPTASVKLTELIEGMTPTCQLEKRYLHKEGRAVWVLWSVSAVRDTQNEVLHLIFQIQDITDRKRAEGQLIHDASHDALTGLPNRALFTDRLTHAFERAKRHEDQQFAVLFLDFDRFKLVNDSLGHLVGDELLKGIAQRLEEAARGEDTVARIGGDEFTILFENLKHPDEAIAVAERIKEEMARPFNLCGDEVFTSASIGIALSTEGYTKAEDILRDADTAMYRAKALGKSRHEIFDREMHTRANEALTLETDLRRAVERQEFVVHYQPIVELATGRISGFEALVRWQHPKLGLLSPAKFIPMAEETGLIVQIGEWVLGESCRQMRLWQEQFPTYPPLTISVNLSGKQFAQAGLVNYVKQVLHETNLDPRSLKLEITESAVMENIETATGMLKQLRALGVTLSMDDFGTGYSSLSYLNRFPISTLKIDRSFINQIAGQD
ncbi:MAG: EAL domain-containing protein, partial [Pyrinomonadaceae bacterium]|nr:EAL domain-containing protein [Pyrinomonadaceae bacterium]